jgi:Putative Se/S carrier protein-like
MMMVRDGQYVAIFNSIHRVMKAEKVLKELRLPILLIPVPRTLAADCGLAIRYGDADRAAVDRALADAGLVPEEVYVRSGEDYEKIPEQVQHRAVGDDILLKP